MADAGSQMAPTYDELVAIVRELKDRQEIEACLLRYCRGVDRFDRELMLSAYHADAVDDHGLVVLGAPAFVDWAIEFHTSYNPLHHHAITNLSIELDGDTAHCESYFTYIGTLRDAPSLLIFGRYVDRLEKRDGKWGIAARKCFSEAPHEIIVATFPDEFAALLDSNGPRARDRSDASYERPLVISSGEHR